MWPKDEAPTAAVEEIGFRATLSVPPGARLNPVNQLPSNAGTPVAKYPRICLQLATAACASVGLVFLTDVKDTDHRKSGLLTAFVILGYRASITEV